MPPMPPVLMTRVPVFDAATMVAATVVPPNPGLTIAPARFQGETLTASVRPARAAHSSRLRPTRSSPSKTATTAGVAFAVSHAVHCCRTASTAAALGRPCVITADSRATTAAPEAMASRTDGAIVRLVTLGMLRGYIQQDAAGVAELVQAHGLGPCGASHGGSSPFARIHQIVLSATEGGVDPVGGNRVEGLEATPIPVITNDGASSGRTAHGIAGTVKHV